MTDYYKKEIEIKKEEFNDLVTELHSPLENTGRGFKLWIGFLVALLALAGFMYVRQLQNGLSTTDMRDIASWGLYIADFVFLIAVSLVGSLITAILRLSNVKWATPLTRISEIIAVAALVAALLIIVVDMGRPDRLWHIFVYGRLQSPIVWDILVVNTYLVISLLLLYIPLIPDIAILKRKMAGQRSWRLTLYKILSLGWEGTEKQFRLMNISLITLMVIIIPVAFSIHTVTSWLFASTLRPGWDSTIFGPYFVSGAFMVGAAAVVVIMYLIREIYKFQAFITNQHFNLMGKLLVLTSLLYLYFNLNEFMVPAYKMKSGESEHILGLFVGEFSVMFWMVQVFGMILPIILMIFKSFRKPIPLFVISVFIVIGAFLKRYLIVTPTLLHPYLPVQNYPESYHNYIPTFSEMTITIGSIAGIALVISLFIKLFPIVPVYETAHEKGFSNEIINNA